MRENCPSVTQLRSCLWPGSISSNTLIPPALPKALSWLLSCCREAGRGGEVHVSSWLPKVS